MLGCRTAHCIDGLPGNEHGHYCRFACAGGEFQGKPHQLGIGVLVCSSEMIKNTFAVPGLGRDLGEPDRSFYRLNLAEEWSDAIELVMTPVLQEAGCLWCHLPLIGRGQGAPGIHKGAHFVDG